MRRPDLPPPPDEPAPAPEPALPLLETGADELDRLGPPTRQSIWPVKTYVVTVRRTVVQHTRVEIALEGEFEDEQAALAALRLQPLAIAESDWSAPLTDIELAGISDIRPRRAR